MICHAQLLWQWWAKHSLRARWKDCFQFCMKCIAQQQYNGHQALHHSIEICNLYLEVPKKLRLTWHFRNIQIWLLMLFLLMDLTFFKPVAQIHYPACCEQQQFLLVGESSIEHKVLSHVSGPKRWLMKEFIW